MICRTIFKEFVGIFRGWISPMIFIFGLFGNIFVISIFTRKQLRNRFSIYSLFLAFSHIIILITDTFLDDFFGRGLAYTVYNECEKHVYKFDIISNSSCKTMQYIPEMMYSISSWIFVVFSIDRVLTIYRPFLFYSNLHTKKSIIICCVVVAISGLINIPLIIGSGVHLINIDNSTILKCDLLIESQYFASRVELFIKIIFSFIVPTIIVLFVNCFIIGKLFQIKRTRRDLMPTDRTKNGLEMSRVIGHLGLSSMFLLLVFPLVVVMFIRMYWTDKSYRNLEEKVYIETLGDLSRFFSSFKDISYAADFYIYMIFLRNFKWYFLGNILDLLLIFQSKSQKLNQWKLSVNSQLSGKFKQISLPSPIQKGAENAAFQSDDNRKNFR